MTDKKNYSGIDFFRLIAALLIIAIHTSPLSSFNETADFILTRIIARVAVPFFLMTSGFFLISEYTQNTKKLTAFIKKTLLIYAAAILIYIPINIYNGYFKTDYLLPNIIKDIIFDGTLYHLWYLPASVIGAVIAWYLVKTFKYPKAFAASAILYTIGLFGDSYYGISDKISCLNNFYQLIFQVSDYTRNGIFYAPIFFIIGGFIADKRQETGLLKSICGFFVSFTLMFAEALILHRFKLQRHDSMYVFLLPCMYFLFNIILYFKGKRHTGFKNMSLIIYIIHPMMIVIIRLFAKLFHMQKWLIENSLIHYFTVCLTSVIFSLLLTVLYNKCMPKKTKQNPGTDRAYLQIDLNSLEHNVKVLKEAMSADCELMAVVKAEAYGHGMYEIASHLEKIGVKAFAAATIDEGIMLRRYGIRGEILVLGYTQVFRAKELYKYDLIQTLTDHEYSVLLDEQGYNIKTHIKIDTGMHRLGFDTDEAKNIFSVFRMKNIKVYGIYTHLCVSDSLLDEDVNFTKMQIKSFYKVLHTLEQMHITLPKIHIQSSYGLLNYPELKCDYVRTGIALYGVLSSPDNKTKLHLDLKPVLSLKSKIILIKTVKKGEYVGYGRAFKARKDTKIAIIPIGYADGYPRNLSCGKGYVLINGHFAPIVGKICMDQLTVDITDIPDVKAGTIVTLIGTDGDKEICAAALSDISGSITNEILSRMGRRLDIVTNKTIDDPKFCIKS